MKLNTVTVIGANGLMARNISGVFASEAGAKVYMMCRQTEKGLKAKDALLASGKFELDPEKLVVVGYDDMERCFAESDLIFESIKEDVALKQEMNKKIAPFIPEGTMLCTGTSSLSIDLLAETLPDSLKKTYCGMHFFNPPYAMVGVELIPNAMTDMERVSQLCDYCNTSMKRKCVIVKNIPAFLANRIGHLPITECLQLAEKYKDRGGLDYIESLTGRFMGKGIGSPVQTANFVGAFVMLAVIDNIYESCPNDFMREDFKAPDYYHTLLKRFLVNKEDGALFKTEIGADGSKVELVYDIAADSYRRKRKYEHAFVDKMFELYNEGKYEQAMQTLIDDESEDARLCLELQLKYVLYALVKSIEAAGTYEAADDLMSTTYRWIPPLSFIDCIGGKDAFSKLCKERLDKGIFERMKADAPGLSFDELVAGIPASKYDYRKFLKAKY